VSGSKNSSLAIIIAALLTADSVILQNVPDLLDIHTLLEILRALGADCEYKPTCDFCGKVTVNAANLSSHTPPDELVQNIRASFWLAGDQSVTATGSQHDKQQYSGNLTQQQNSSCM
jgi:UDP-N-acetylglucosamine 1-carboxyvinyltransferase